MSKCAWTFNHPLYLPDAITRFIFAETYDAGMHSPASGTLDLCGPCAAYFRSEVEPNPTERIEQQLVPVGNLSRERIPA